MTGLLEVSLSLVTNLNGTVNISQCFSQCFTPNPRLATGSHHLRCHQVITNIDSYKDPFYPCIIPLCNILPVDTVPALSHQGFGVVALQIIRCLPPNCFLLRMVMQSNQFLKPHLWFMSSVWFNFFVCCKYEYTWTALHSETSRTGSLLLMMDMHLVLI